MCACETYDVFQAYGERPILYTFVGLYGISAVHISP